MEPLSQIVREEVKKYAASGRGANLRLFALLDDEQQVYGVNAIDHPRREDSEAAGVVVLARIVDNVVVVEEDATNKPLVDALLQRGVPRNQIVLAYEGDPIPDAARFERSR